MGGLLLLLLLVMTTYSSLFDSMDPDLDLGIGVCGPLPVGIEFCSGSTVFIFEGIMLTFLAFSISGLNSALLLLLLLLLATTS